MPPITEQNEEEKMDPQAALYDLASAMAAGNRAEAEEILESLSEWVARGGLLPQLPRDHRTGAYLITR
jgi:hypothetical protein